MAATIDTVAWVLLDGGRILGTRSRGKDVYYIPGGKREPGESDLDTLLREVDEELAVSVLPHTAEHLGTFEAPADGHPDGTTVRMACYLAEYRGRPSPRSEIEELAWLTYADRARVAPVDQVVFDYLRQIGQLG